MAIMNEAGKARWSYAAGLGLWAMLLAPLAIFFHELGHFLVGSALGVEGLILRPTSVGTPPGGAEAEAWIVGAQAAAGPIVTIALALIAALFLRRQDDNRWAIALAAAAPLRLFIAPVYLGLQLMVAFGWITGGRPNFDEYNVARALAIPLIPILVVESLLLVVMFALAWRAIPRGRRMAGLILFAAGSTAGIMLWSGVIGPLLLG